MSEEIVTANQPHSEDAVSLWSNATTFEHAQRVAKALSASSLVPEHFRGNIPNTLIAMDMAARLRANVMAVMQSIYIVHGKPGWAATFITAMINACGKFSPLRFKLSGEGDGLKCQAWAKELSSGEIVEGPPVSIRMAKEEGWFSKNGSKWKTMPELMLHYRSATFFGRLYCPELLLGMQTMEEATETAAPQEIANVIVPMPKPGIPITEEPEPNQSVQEQLADIVVNEAGVNFDEFRSWAEESGNWESDASSFAELPAGLCRRLVASKTGLVTQLKATKG